jgi:hypothetical protein
MAVIDTRIHDLLVPAVLDVLFPIQAPDAQAYPYATYLVMNQQNLTTHSAPLPATRMWRFQFNVYSPTYALTRGLGNAIELALVGYTDSAVLGITQLNSKGSYDDISKVYCWMTELLVTETLNQ